MCVSKLGASKGSTIVTLRAGENNAEQPDILPTSAPFALPAKVTLLWGHSVLEAHVAPHESCCLTQQARILPWCRRFVPVKGSLGHQLRSRGARECMRITATTAFRRMPRAARIQVDQRG